jgi:uncharacterized protein
VIWRLPLVVALPWLAVQPVPPPADKVSADCAAPVYASDQLVCADPALRSIDLRYRAELDALGEIGSDPGAIWESNVDWFRRRGQCAFLAIHRECLLAAYDDRRSLFAAIAAARRKNSESTCQQAGVTATLHLFRAADGAVVLRDENGIVAVASPAVATRAGWVAFATARLAPGEVEIRTQGGQVLACVQPPGRPPG